MKMTLLQRIVFLAVVMVLTIGICHAAFTYPFSRVDLRQASAYESGGPLSKWCNEVEDRIDGTTAAAGIKLTTFKLGTTTFTLPTADGTTGQVMTTNGSGTLAWSANGGTWTGGAISSDGVLANGKYIETDTTVAHTGGLALRDTTAGAYVPVVLMTNGTTNGTNAVAFGYSSVPMTIASYGGLNVGATGNMSGVGTVALGGDVTLTADGKYLKTDTTTAHTWGIQAYDVDGTTYRNALLVTNANTPAVVLGNAYDSVAITSTGFNVDTAGAVSGVASVTSTSGIIEKKDIVSLTANEIKALYSSGKTLVSAGGANTVIDVISVMIFSKGGSTGWNNVSNNIGVYYNTGAGTACTGTIAQNAAFSTSTSTNLTAKLIPVAVTGTASASIVNVPVVLACATADPTTGNGTATVSISYRVIPTGY